MVEFISYDGKYPNLCGGLLVLKIYNKLYAFCQFSKKTSDDNSFHVWEKGSCIRNNQNIIKVYNFSLISGGTTDWTARNDNERIKQGSWEVGLNHCYLDNGDPFPYMNMKSEIEKVINENIEQGCCGGCL